MEKINWLEKVNIEEFMYKRTLLNNIIRRKDYYVGHILRRNCFLHNAIEGRIMDVKRVGRRRAQLLDDLRNRRR